MESESGITFECLVQTREKSGVTMQTRDLIFVLIGHQRIGVTGNRIGKTAMARCLLRFRRAHLLDQRGMAIGELCILVGR